MTDLFKNLGQPVADTSSTDKPVETKTETSDKKTAPAPAKEPVKTEPKEEAPVVEDVPVPDEEEEYKEPTELELLKQRADFMKLGYASDITVEGLRDKINAKLEGVDQEADKKLTQKTDADLPVAEDAVPARHETNEAKLRKHLYQENMKLVRVRVTNMDPNDADLTCQFFSVSNDYIGTVTKTVPFGEGSENGFHIPYCIYKQMRAMKFLQIKTIGKGSKARVESNWVRKFAIEVLPPLTDKEIDSLKASQLARGTGFDD